MTCVGVDGTPDGWLAVAYSAAGYEGAREFADVAALWAAYPDADLILVDVPIGLRETSSEPRPCDAAARERLSPRRHRSVFPPPVRAAAHADSYEAAKATQEELTDGSLGVQTWGIAPKIAELDTFLLETAPEAQGVVREAHPEVCFWALAGERATTYSKTGQPAAAFWERLAVLAAVDGDGYQHVRDAGRGLDSRASNDDLLDAFALALTASPLTGAVATLGIAGAGTDEDPGDPRGLPMEMVYATSEECRDPGRP